MSFTSRPSKIHRPRRSKFWASLNDSNTNRCKLICGFVDLEVVAAQHLQRVLDGGADAGGGEGVVPAVVGVRRALVADL